MVMDLAEFSVCIMVPKFFSFCHMMKQHRFGGCARLNTHPYTLITHSVHLFCAHEISTTSSLNSLSLMPKT